jgi:hypothetical protein
LIQRVASADDRVAVLGGCIGVAHLELSDEVLRAIDAAIAETGAGVDQASAVPGHGRRDDGPASHYSQTRAFTRTERRRLLRRIPVLRQRLTFLNVEVIYRCQGHSAAGACPAPASIGAMYLEACVEDRFFDLLRRRPRASGPSCRSRSR